MPLLIDTTGEHGLPTADLLLFALPGVGDVGKNAIEMLNESSQAERVARFIHPGLAPLARLDEDGLLAPPHLYASLFTTPSGQRVMTILGQDNRAILHINTISPTISSRYSQNQAYLRFWF